MNKPPATSGDIAHHPLIMEATALKLGGSALLIEINGGQLSIAPVEQDVAVLASHGGTVDTVASELSISGGEVEAARDALIAGFAVPNMAAVISVMISEKILDFESRNGFRRLPDRDKAVLGLIAQGKSNSEIGDVIGKGPQAIRNLNKRLFTMLNANGRTHSVRRSYEFGIFKVYN